MNHVPDAGKMVSAEDALALKVAKEWRYLVLGAAISEWDSIPDEWRESWLKHARAIIEIVRAG